MAKAKTTKAEVNFALSFLKYAGVSAPHANAYLLIAVIAWLRQESGGLHRVIGNNPFNIRSSPFAVGYRKTKNGNGHFAIFKDLDAGARATVALLKSDGAHGWRGYGLILKAATRAVGKSDKDKQQQGLDFLNAIAMSKWDAAQYGTKKATNATEFTAMNHLVRVWSSLLGSPISIPQPQPKTPKPPPPKPIQPDDKLWSTPVHEYIEPYAAFQSYEERKWTPTGPPGDPPVVG